MQRVRDNIRKTVIGPMTLAHDATRENRIWGSTQGLGLRTKRIRSTDQKDIAVGVSHSSAG